MTTALEESRARILDKLEQTAVLIRQREGDPKGYEAAYFLQDKADEDPLSSAFLYQSSPSKDTFQLTDLGKVKCEKLFQCFDDDRDGDPLYHVIQHKETWSMYMNDAYDTNEDGKLTLKGFFMYQEDTEKNYSLANDLIRMGMNWLWPGLERHIHLQALFDSYDKLKLGKIPVNRLQYILGEANIITTRAQSQAIVDQLHSHFLCMDAILQRNRAIRLFGYKQLSRITNIHDKEHIYRDAFLALLLSSWAPPILPRWQEIAQTLHVGAFGFLRRGNESIQQQLRWIRNAAEAGLLHMNLLTKPSDDSGEYTIKVDVGDDFAAESEIHLSYSADCDSSAALYALGHREDGAECFVYFDFLTRQEINENELNNTILAMSKFIEMTWTDHLKIFPSFLKHLVVSPPKSQSHRSIVVRVILLFTEELDPYNVLQQLGLPQTIQFDQFMSQLRCIIMCNVSAEDLLSNKRFSLGKHLAIRSALNFCVGRQACGQVLQQISYQARYEADSRKLEEEYIHAERLKNKLDQRNHVENTDAPCAIPWTEQQKKCKELQTSLWCGLLDQLAGFIRYTKTANINIQVDSIEKLATKNSVIHKLFHANDIKELIDTLTTTGAISKQWKVFYHSLQEELINLACNTAKPLSNSATPTFAQDHQCRKSMVHIYEVLTSNLLTLNEVKAEAGTVGITITLEGLNIIHLLPRIPTKEDMSSRN